MSEKTIVIASDHTGVELKSRLVAELKELGYKVMDFGTNTPDPVDYPDYAQKVAEAIGKGRAYIGVLICSTGIGMSIAANRYPFIRAALVHDIEDTVLCRQHNNANVLVFPAHKITIDAGIDMLKIFLTTNFGEGRHTQRIEKLAKLPTKIIKTKKGKS